MAVFGLVLFSAIAAAGAINQQPIQASTGDLVVAQSAYRWFAESNSTTPGAALAGVNSPITSASSTARLRLAITDNSTRQWDRIDNGGNHTCAEEGGVLWCWGNNPNGQLGNGTTTNSSLPVKVDTSVMSQPVTGFAAGGGQSCAVSGGAVYCWGYSMDGRLGIGYATTTNNLTPTPILTTNITGTPTAVSSLGPSTCAIYSEKVYCWGTNNSGQIGQGATSPVEMTPLSVLTTDMSNPIVELSTGTYHSCAVDDAGQIWCWGRNSNGQLGDGNTTGLPGSTNGTPYPVQVDMSGMNGETAVSVTAGGIHSCAIVTDGTVYCWGGNTYGQLGDGTNVDSPTPVAVDLPAPAVEVTADGSYFTCALLVTNEIYCWGLNSGAGEGELGDDTIVDSNVPVEVDMDFPAGATLTSLTAGYGHTCVLASGRPYCWGINASGQLGNGTTTNALIPTPVDDSQVPIAIGKLNIGDVLQLQFTEKTAATCAEQDETDFAPITNSSLLHWNSAGVPASGSPIGAAAGDPVSGANVVYQTYAKDSGGFRVLNAVTSGKTGLWDLDLGYNGDSPSSPVFCLRAVDLDAAFEAYDYYPEISFDVVIPGAPNTGKLQ